MRNIKTYSIHSNFELSWGEKSVLYVKMICSYAPYVDGLT